MAYARMRQVLAVIYGIWGIFLLELPNFASSSPPTLTEEQARDIRVFVNEVLRCRSMPGLSLAVTSTHNDLMVEGFGFADIEQERRVTAETIIPIGSTTKAFTATLLAKLLHSDGRYDWDTTVREILGEEFELFDQTLTQRTTLRDIMAHKTGIPGYYVSLMAGLPENATRQQIVRRLRHHKPTRPNGMRTNFVYNNFMYLLAGYVAEVLGGDTWEALVRRLFFEPLEMTSSLFVRDVEQEGVKNNMAAPYVYENNENVKIDTATLQQADVAAPAGAILSTARDMSKWLQFHLRKGTTPSGEWLLPRDVLAETYHWEMVSPPPMSDRDLIRPHFPISDVLVAYDLGWMTSIYKGYERTWHSGGLSSYKTQVWFYPDLEFGIFASTNGPPTAGSSWAMILMLYYISDVIIGDTPWLNATTACSFPEPWKQPIKPRPPVLPNDSLALPHHAYTGRYTSPGFDDVIIGSSTDGHLELRMSRFLEAILHYDATSDRFVTELTGYYWHLKDHIPVRFNRSHPATTGGRFDVLEMPLYHPYDTAQPTRFCRVGDDANGADHSDCSGASAGLPAYQLWLLLVTFVVANF